MTFYTALDISTMLGIALSNAYKLMKKPDFPAIRVSSKRFVVPEEAFKKWLDDQIEAKKKEEQKDAAEQ